MFPPSDARLSMGERAYIAQLIQRDSYTNQYGVPCPVTRRIIADLLHEMIVYEQALISAGIEIEKLRERVKNGS